MTDEVPLVRKPPPQPATRDKSFPVPSGKMATGILAIPASASAPSTHAHEPSPPAWDGARSRRHSDDVPDSRCGLTLVPQVVYLRPPQQLGQRRVHLGAQQLALPAHTERASTQAPARAGRATEGADLY